MKVHDEVCGMTIESETAAASREFRGTRYFFCAERCRRLFDEHPEWYVPVNSDGDERTAESAGS